jgi:hypothetical protein
MTIDDWEFEREQEAEELVEEAIWEARSRRATKAWEQCKREEAAGGEEWTPEHLKTAYEAALVAVEETERKQWADEKQRRSEYARELAERRARDAQQTSVAQPKSFVARLINGISQLCEFVVGGGAILALIVGWIGGILLIGLMLLVYVAIVVWAFRVLFG